MGAPVRDTGFGTRGDLRSCSGGAHLISEDCARPRGLAFYAAVTDLCTRRLMVGPLVFTQDNARSIRVVCATQRLRRIQSSHSSASE